MKHEFHHLKNSLSCLRFALLLSCALICPSSSEAQEQNTPAQQANPSATSSSEWLRYTVDGDKFSVLLPVMPAMITYPTRTRDNRDSLQKVRIIGAYSDGVAYAIEVFERSGSGDVAQLTGMEFKRDIVVDGVNGKEYSYENKNQKGTVQLFRTSTHIHLFRAIGSKLIDPDGGITRFFSSLNFAPKPGDIKITDGPGNRSGEANPLRIDGGQVEIIKARDVDVKISVVSKPEPYYTEGAREADVVGTVVLRVVFGSNGAITHVRVVSGLPHGLTEQAIFAARQIKFHPAIKDNRFVSIWVELQYNFNLY